VVSLRHYHDVGWLIIARGPWSSSSFRAVSPRTSESVRVTIRRRRSCSTPSIMQCRGYRPILCLCHPTTRRRHSTLPKAALPADFLWFPRFFDLSEQHALLSAALRKLDAVEPTAPRRHRRNYLASRTRVQQQPREVRDPKDVFLPDDIYHFEEVRHLPNDNELIVSPPPAGPLRWCHSAIPGNANFHLG
jgi:hypothetical protein